MAEGDFAKLLEVLIEVHKLNITQLIGKKPINCVKNNKTTFDLCRSLFHTTRRLHNLRIQRVLFWSDHGCFSDCRCVRVDHFARPIC